MPNFSRDGLDRNCRNINAAAARQLKILQLQLVIFSLLFLKRPFPSIVLHFVKNVRIIKESMKHACNTGAAFCKDI